MPSARSSSFSGGGGGILRKKDGTILRVEFTTENPLWKDKSKTSESGFKSLFGVLHIQEDGREQVSLQPLFVGNADDYTVVLDGQGVSGVKGFSKSSDWFIFLNSLSNPIGGGEGFDETVFPEDPEGLVADYRALAGQRVQFDWQENAKKTAKLGRRPAKKDGKPVLDAKGQPVTYPQEDLVVGTYYGRVDVVPAKAVVAAKSGTIVGAAKAAKPAAAAAAPAADVTEMAEEAILKALMAAKGRSLSKNRLSVKLLTSIQADEATIEAVRTWAMNDSNLSAIDGVNVAGDTVSLAA